MAPVNMLTNVVISSTLAIGLVVLLVWWRDRKRRAHEERIPDKWRRVGTLSELNMFPLKSGAPMPLENAECTGIGLRTTATGTLKLRDRFFMVFDESGNMKTARQYPTLLFVKMVPGHDSITLTAPNMEDVNVKIPKGANAKKATCKMWKSEEVEIVDCGDEVATWMASFLQLKSDSDVRVGCLEMDQDGEPTRRRDGFKKPWIDFAKFYDRFRSYDMGAYSDMAPYMLMAETSMQDLKQKVGDKAPNLCAQWFRPNFVVKGTSVPFEEDAWNFIKIGDEAIFQNFKPCARCVMTTIDPLTAKKNPDMQPLRTLKTYRKLQDPQAAELDGPDSPAMGRYIGLRHAGMVRLGDAVYVGE